MIYKMIIDYSDPCNTRFPLHLMASLYFKTVHHYYIISYIYLSIAVQIHMYHSISVQTSL